jgi:hypothetical protein
LRDDTAKGRIRRIRHHFWRLFLVIQPKSEMATETLQITIRGDYQHFVEEAVRLDLEFIVVGSVALAFYGCRPLEAIHDLDILINPTLPNANRVNVLLNSLQFSCLPAPEKIIKPGIQLPAKNQSCCVDILTPQKELDFSTLRSRSRETSIGSTRARVMGLNDLINMKEIAEKTGKEEHEKHLKDLTCLKAV